MKKKLIVDILLFVLLILEFSRMYMAPIYHEIIGIVLFILVIIHLGLNINYIKKITVGKYSLKRILMLIINIFFMISFLLSIILGLLSSQDLLSFMNINNMNVIKFHKICAYLSLIFMGLHLGINFNIMFGKITKMVNNKIILYVLSIVIMGLGIYSWINLDIWNHITGRYGFSIITGNIFINILEYLSIIMMISIIMNFVYRRIGEDKNER